MAGLEIGRQTLKIHEPCMIISGRPVVCALGTRGCGMKHEKSAPVVPLRDAAFWNRVAEQLKKGR